MIILIKFDMYLSFIFKAFEENGGSDKAISSIELADICCVE